MDLYGEDKRSVTSSILLSNVFNIKYLGSNGKIRESIFNRIFGIYYLDVVPDNSKLNVMYDECNIFIENENLQDKIFLVPIVCAEYYIIKSIVSLGIDFNFSYIWYNVVLEAILNMKTIKGYYPSKKEYKYRSSFDTFEKQCKLLLNGADSRFTVYDTDNITKHKLFKDISYYLNNSDNLTLYDKSIEVARYYPVVLLKCKPQSGFNRICNLRSYVDSIRDSYIEWRNSDSIKIKLPDNWWLDENIESSIKIIRGSK